MGIIYFLYGLSFFGLGFAAYLQIRRGGDFPLRRQLPWLAAFGFAFGATGWVEMFLVSETNAEILHILEILRMVLQPVSGLLLFIFGLGILSSPAPLPSWSIFIPGLLTVPVAYVFTYALSTFVTPSPIEIPIDIWSRYLLYLPGSILAGIGFMRLWLMQRRLGYKDVANLMLGAGLAFLFEAFVMGLVVPAAPYGPASYYNYDRVAHNALGAPSFYVEQEFGLSAWLDDEQVRAVTGLPIQFWRMLSAFAVTFFVARGLDVFEAIQKRQMKALQDERDRAHMAAFEAQLQARRAAEQWTEALTSISSHIIELQDVDNILRYIVETARAQLQTDFIGLALLGGEPLRLNLKCYGLPSQTEITAAPIRVENPLILQAVQTQTTIRLSQDENQESLKGACFYTEDMARSLCAVGLSLDGAPIGALWCSSIEQREFSETDLIWLESLADQVIIAIKHGLMTSQLQSISVLEERGRIAREMHDGLAQVLGYMNIQVQTVSAFLNQGKLDRAQEKLDQMHTAVQTAHADVRERILSLRTTLSNDKGLVPSIQEYLQEFGLQTGIRVRFDQQAEGELGLASLAEVQLVCIMQEALTNVRKHARARQVTVTLSRGGDRQNPEIVLVVCDDGTGMSREKSKHQYGLQTMRERAESAGGTLSVRSTLGQGVEVECRIPCIHQEHFVQQSTIL